MTDAHMDLWLGVDRVQSTARAGGQVGSAGNHLWIDRWGDPMSSRAIQRQIWLRTRHAFGKGICPHLFRDCAVTELVDCAPEDLAEKTKRGSWVGRGFSFSHGRALDIAAVWWPMDALASPSACH